MRDCDLAECVFKEFGEEIGEVLGKAVVETGGDDGLPC
jgi:hypothetical protein